MVVDKSEFVRLCVVPLVPCQEQSAYLRGAKCAVFYASCQGIFQSCICNGRPCLCQKKAPKIYDLFFVVLLILIRRYALIFSRFETAHHLLTKKYASKVISNLRSKEFRYLSHCSSVTALCHPMPMINLKTLILDNFPCRPVDKIINGKLLLYPFL